MHVDLSVYMFGVGGRGHFCTHLIVYLMLYWVVQPGGMLLAVLTRPVLFGLHYDVQDMTSVLCSACPTLYCVENAISDVLEINVH